MISIQEIRDRFTPEMALVILICRVYFNRANREEIDHYLVNNKVDWKLFEQINAAHQIRPFIFKTLSANSSSIPPDVIATLRNNSFGIAKGNLQKLEELVRLHKLFKANAIPNIPYKGVILSQFLFSDYISRETSDIDFLVDKEYFSKAHGLLIDDGYKPRFYNPDFERQFLRSSHELLYRKNYPAGAIKIEIHWAATNNMMNIPLPNEYLFTDLKTIKLLGEEIDIFNVPNHLLILLVHHGVNDVWRTLRHCIDIAVFLEQYGAAIDWPAFQETTKKYKINHTTTVGFLIARELFGIEIPPTYRINDVLPEKILDNLLRFPAIKKRKLNIENLQQQLFLRDSFADKLQLLLAYIYAGLTPNVRDMEAITVPKHWYLLYYFIKPFRILFGRAKWKG